jgi:hypothetical protein
MSRINEVRVGGQNSFEFRIRADEKILFRTVTKIACSCACMQLLQPAVYWSTHRQSTGGYRESYIFLSLAPLATIGAAAAAAALALTAGAVAAAEAAAISLRYSIKSSYIFKNTLYFAAW